MSLEFELPDDRPLDREGITCKLEVAKISLPPEDFIIDYCFCDLDCDEDILVFAGTDRRTNDYFNLYYKSKDEDAIVKFFINDEEILDTTLGEDIPNGFRVDFGKVFNIKGPGKYKLSIEVLEFGITKTKEWANFLVAPFDLDRADGTTRIRAYQNGSIEDGFDFEGENVEFEIRIPANFYRTGRVIDTKYNPTNSRFEELVHKRKHKEYEMKFCSSKYQFLGLLFDNMLQGTEILIDDYNLDNGSKQFNELRVIETDTDIEPIKNSTSDNYVIKFEDADKTNVKHPYLNR